MHAVSCVADRDGKQRSLDDGDSGQAESYSVVFASQRQHSAAGNFDLRTRTGCWAPTKVWAICPPILLQTDCSEQSTASAALLSKDLAVEQSSC